MIKIPPQIYSDWIKLLKQEEVTKNELVNREKIIEGNIAHALLSRIDNCWQKDTKPMIEAAVSDTQRLYPFVQDFSTYTAKIEKLLSHHKLKNIFYVPDGDVHCEKEIVDASGNLKRVDRLIVREKEVTVIDYKTTAKAESTQREQIKEYLKIFAAIYPQKRLKGFLVYLDDFSLEEISLDV